MKRLLLLTLMVAMFSWAGTAFACPEGQFRVRIDPVCGADDLIALGNDVYFLVYMMPSGNLIIQEPIEGDGVYLSGCIGGIAGPPVPDYQVKIGYCKPWESRLHIAWAATTFATVDNKEFCTDFGTLCAECDEFLLSPKGVQWAIEQGGSTEDIDFSTVKVLY